ncbi:MAG: hypothetical protein ABJF10_24585 [Chthoniobacter sp.]|uniref:hypothetical protein n=1 Tax=Chthoniobacter sp. TaxID=2510640 RepID=UPI0032A6AC6B
MSRVEEIKTAIDQLSPQERCELEALLHPVEDDEWDAQMKADCEVGGKLDKLKVEAQEAVRRGELRDWPGAE